jgi:hypothetical protein
MTFHEFQTEVYNVTKKRDDVRDELRKALQTLVANDVDLIICEVTSTSKLIILYDYFTKNLIICEVTSKLIMLFHNHLRGNIKTNYVICYFTIICEVTSKLIMLYDYFTKKLNICEVTSKLIT